jgi:D-glycero-D-manno-heptose 1,7-bisphosphate phosphatase
VRRAVFLDRDGTIIEEAGYLERLERMVFFPYSVDAIRLLNKAGFAVVVVTNQAGIARGLLKESFVAEAHRHISERLAAGGARVDAYYYCPHHPQGVVEALAVRCNCRKPRPGMLKHAAEEHHLDLTRSFVVGDRWHDVELAQHVGAAGILVRSGLGKRDAANQPANVRPAAVVDNLIDAAAWILRAP